VRDVIVFSGSAHEPLARRICRHLGVPLSGAEIKRFSNDCLQAQLLANCRQRDVYIVQPLVPPTQDHLVELLMMIDAARGASAAQITAVIPHYAYARSDKKDASRISLGGRLVADMLVTAGVNRVLTMALHAPQVHGFFSVPVDHLTAIGVLADHFVERDLSDYVVVSPDLGNAKQATLFARLLGLPVAAGSKQRLSDDKVVIDAIVGDVAGKRAIVLDDEIATGGSIVELLDKLAEAGCPSAAVACTHGLFAGSAVQRLSTHPMITEVVTTDTVPRPAGFGALHVRSVSRLFAEAIGRIHVGESVSSLFDGVDPAHASPQRQLPLYDGYESFDDGYADAGGHLFSGSRYPFEPGQASRSSAAGRPVESTLRPVVSEPVPLLSVAEPQLDDAEALS
jgi:ribose-phosphate pyrophosphokinase